jgi:hypothetical protein
MILKYVLTATNDNPLYIDFIPIFIKTWNKLYPNVKVIIILIANEIPEKYLKYKDNIILFEPINEIKTCFTSQIIRLFYPCILDSNDGILITDIDILPMNRTYFTQNIQNYDNDKFIYYRENVCFNEQQIAMCYNVATPKIWKDVFNINNKEDIINKIKNIYFENNTWFADQIMLFKYIKNWKLKQTNFVCLNEKETKFKRLNRNTFDINNIETIILNNTFSDYHCLRPMSKYSEINNKIVDLL